MVLWYGPWQSNRVLEVTRVLRVDHRGGAAWVEIVGCGERQCLKFIEEHPHLKLVGWCHSHHTLQGVPSVVDVAAHWLFQSIAESPILMAIWFIKSDCESDCGLRIWPMSSASHSKLSPTKGRVASDQQPMDVVSRVASTKASFSACVSLLGCLLPPKVVFARGRR